MTPTKSQANAAITILLNLRNKTQDTKLKDSIDDLIIRLRKGID